MYLYSSIEPINMILKSEKKTKSYVTDYIICMIQWSLLTFFQAPGVADPYQLLSTV